MDIFRDAHVAGFYKKNKKFKNFSPNKICKYQLSFNEYKKNFKMFILKKRYSKLVFKSKTKLIKILF